MVVDGNQMSNTRTHMLVDGNQFLLLIKQHTNLGFCLNHHFWPYPFWLPFYFGNCIHKYYNESKQWSRNWLPSTSMWVRVLLNWLPSTNMWVRVLLICLPSTSMWVCVLHMVVDGKQMSNTRTHLLWMVISWATHQLTWLGMVIRWATHKLTCCGR
jgi:hypothetical protein